VKLIHSCSKPLNYIPKSIQGGNIRGKGDALVQVADTVLGELWRRTQTTGASIQVMHKNQINRVTNVTCFSP
jgi:hypothetical protein